MSALISCNMPFRLKGALPLGQGIVSQFRYQRPGQKSAIQIWGINWANFVYLRCVL
jgi:hypothetical protein